MGSRFTIPVPRDFVLRRDACSYGYFVLEPNLWVPATRTLHRVLDLAGGPARLAVTHDRRGESLRVMADRAITRAERAEVMRAVARMLRLDEDHTHVQAFHEADPRWKRAGRARLFRSPTLFEDVIKTVTSCNVTWPSTVIMNRKLCAVVGRGGAFPTPARLARVRVQTLRARCGVGYRDARIVEMARLFASGELEQEWFEDPARSDDEIRERLLELPGIGPYAAANILQLLGRYGHIPLDTESVRHGRAVLGMKGPSARVMKRVRAHFEPFGPHKFRSYWFELWTHYERKAGPSWTWQRDRVSSTFTAANL